MERRYFQDYISIITKKKSISKFSRIEILKIYPIYSPILIKVLYLILIQSLFSLKIEIVPNTKEGVYTNIDDDIKIVVLK